MLLDLLFPKQCLSCNKYGSYICDNCAAKITRHNQTCIVCYHYSPFGKTHPECQKHTPLNGAILTTEYKELTRHALHQIKYKLNYDILRELLQKTLDSKKIAQCLIQEEIELCTEVPMHPYKQNQRGFNQALLMAKWLAGHYSISYRSLLIKKHNTLPQMKLSREERIFNIKNAFLVKDPSLINGRNILFVDDVTTTASTLEECASIAKKAGAGKVWAIVIAARR